MSAIHGRGAIVVGLLMLTGDLTAAPGRHGAHATTPSDDAALVAELERLTDGLLFMSERDSPLSVVRWARPGGRPTARRIAAFVGEPHPALVESLTVEQFFRAALLPRASHEAEEEATVRRYTALVGCLKSHLLEIRVFRFGRTTIRSYVVGLAPDGDWIGIATLQIET